MKKKVLITGGTGFVGRNLTNLLVEEGYEVSILSRSEKENKPSISYYVWDVKKQVIDEKAVLEADFIIHLAGENIAGKRWTSQRKKAIIDSRVQPVQLIKTVLDKHNKKLDAFISASAIGIYGAQNGSRICHETRKPGTDFLGTTCVKWEAAADTVSPFVNRIVKIRTGLVLGKNEGFLKKIIPVFKWKLGAVLGSGKQYMPWIHIDDLCGIYLHAIRNSEMNGAYNAAINDNVTNTIFSITLAKVLGDTVWLPNVPSFVLKLAMGEMSKIVLKGRRVSSEKVVNTGFQFKYKDLAIALRQCI